MEQQTLEPFIIASSDFCSLRITTDNTLQEVFQYFAKKYNIVLVSEEGGDEFTKLHYHLILGDTATALGRGYQNVRHYVLVRWPELAGNTNKYCVKKVDKITFKTALSYTLKDGKYVYKNFSDSLIERMKKLSYKKFDKQVFAKALECLRIEFIDKKQDILTGIAAINRLKTSYNQIPNETNTLNLIKLWYLQQDPSHQDDYDKMIANKALMQLGIQNQFYN